jgi:ribosome maturation factor RimP
MSGLEQIEPLIEDKCRELGYELFDVRFFRAGSRSIIRIFIDAPRGATVADCEKVSTAISVLLDVENFLNGRSYTLEVSSPGADRPLKTERDFKRIYGRDVSVNLREPVNGKTVYTGTVKKCYENILSLDCAGEEIQLSLDLLLSGKEKIKFK